MTINDKSCMPETANDESNNPVKVEYAVTSGITGIVTSINGDLEMRLEPPMRYPQIIS